MFFLGHMVWAYIFSRPFSKYTNIPLIMLLGILPDIDIIFNSFIIHRTFTHSIPVLTILSIPFFVKYRRRSLPYYIALIQHILFGDLIVGKTQIFWPFAPTIGLGYRLTSIENIIIEGIGLGIFLVLIMKDKVLWRKERSNILILIPLLPLASFPIIYSIYEFDNESIENPPELIIDENAPLASSLHIILAIVLMIILVNGIRAYIYSGNFSKYGDE